MGKKINERRSGRGKRKKEEVDMGDRRSKG